MSVWNVKTDGEMKAIQDLVKESDRGAAIIAGTFVEDRLKQGLICKLRRDTAYARDHATRVFDFTGPLGTFAAKIRLGFLLRLYGRQVCNELMTIKDVRNSFAHIIGDAAVLSFTSPEIVKFCEKFKIIEHYFRPTAEATLVTDPVEATAVRDYLR
jgi:hypothetical protein